MERIHFLNVDEGTCILVEHASGRKTLIDICSGNLEEEVTEMQPVEFLKESSIKGNFHFKDHPTNPISYLMQMKIESVFRFILTHPDMDHMDGIKNLFDRFNVTNFWDIQNSKKMGEDFGKYLKEDWECYQDIRKGKRCTVLYLEAGAKGVFYNQGQDGDNERGDSLTILAPNDELIKEANDNGNYNNSSYVVLYTTCRGRKILFPGDSEDMEWNFITKNFLDELKDIDVLVAPHHGRCSGGNECFLDIMKPKLTLFGNANSNNLNYDDWNKRELLKITSNQAGNILIEQNGNGLLDVYVENSKIEDKESKKVFSKCVGGCEYYIFKRI